MSGVQRKPTSKKSPERGDIQASDLIGNYGERHQTLKSDMTTLPEPRGFLIAPILVPSLHVLFTPLWSILGGKPELAVLAMAWQCIAWFDLVAVCLATLSPALWVVRRKIAAFPHRSLFPRHKLLIALTTSILASFFLMGPYPSIRSVPMAWFFAYLSAACFLSGVYTPPDGLLVQECQPASLVITSNPGIE
jgi:hypothetical protein